MVQKEPNPKNYLEYICGTIKAAIIEDDDNLTRIFTCSMYYTEPVNIFITFTKKMAHTTKSQIWDTGKKFFVGIYHLLINMIYDYNHGIRGVDVDDNLYLQLREYNWM